MYSENLSVSAVKANLFDKRTVVELSEYQMIGVDGGTSPATASSIVCGAAVVASVAAAIDAAINLVNYLSPGGGGGNRGGECGVYKAVKVH
jgi:hypothetical protein